MTNDQGGGMRWEWIKGMKFSRVIRIAMVIVMAGGLVVYLCGSKEPSYEGKTLTWWLEKDYSASMAAWARQPVEPNGETCKRAIRSMGTNAIPLLLKYQSAKENRFQTKFRTLLGPRLSRHFRVRDPRFWNELGSIGFYELGTNALAATPMLVKLAKLGDESQSFFALSALEQIHPGEKLVPVLIQMFEDTANPRRAEAGLMLSQRDVEAAERVGVFKAFPSTNRGFKKPANTSVSGMSER